MEWLSSNNKKGPSSELNGPIRSSLSSGNTSTWTKFISFFNKLLGPNHHKVDYNDADYNDLEIVAVVMLENAEELS